MILLSRNQCDPPRGRGIGLHVPGAAASAAGPAIGDGHCVKTVLQNVGPYRGASGLAGRPQNNETSGQLPQLMRPHTHTTVAPA